MSGPRANITAMFDHQIFTSQVHGGISRYFAALAANLPDEGISPRIVAPLHINGHVADLPWTVLPGMKIPAGRWPAAMARRLDALAVRVATRMARPSLLHETYYTAARSAPRGVPVVLTVYDMIHELFAGSVPNDPTQILKAKAIARADCIICISESTLADLVRFYPEAESRAVVTLLGFDPYPLAHRLVREDKPYLLYVGQRGGYKNFAMLLEAYAQSPLLRRDFTLVCVGGGQFTAAETAAIAGYDLDGRSVQQVTADDEELQTWYRGAAAFVYPSLYEGFGIPPLEAMAQQCPVICLATASIPEVCGDAASYAEEASSAAIREAIERVVDSTDIADTLRTRATAQLARFSWRRCTAQTAAIYRTLT